MKAFAQVAIPHRDVVEGKLTMDIFAADLWQVVTGKAPADYKDPDLFFKKTYMTKGLQNIIEVAEKRLSGNIGDSVIQLQTPFGGGKTHALIALYHKAKEWNAKVAVFDGTAFNPAEVRPWEEIERQLTGKIEITKGEISPGKEKIVDLISSSSPVLILMDEILEYATKAAGVRVGDSNLASQLLAFIQELSGAVSTVPNALLVITLPASILEHYDETAERMFQQLQKITGRMEKIYTPVEDEEIEHVIRARLFQHIDLTEAKKVVDEFVSYARKEGLLKEDEEGLFRERFIKSYPFKPDVIDILYKRWGSFPTFQRTRGVLRLLSLVVHDLLEEKIPFIRLGDFNLNNNEIRRELVKHIGQEWDSIIAQDITSPDSGAKKVDESLLSYKPYRLGTVVSTTIFMTSFSGRGERGSSIRELKLSSIVPEIPSSVIDTVINELKEKLFYLSDEGLYFTNQPNLNRIVVSKEENIQPEEIEERIEEIVKNSISKSGPLKTYLFPKFSKDIPDTPELKLVILDKEVPGAEFVEKNGESPRVYRNTLIFLCVDEYQREPFRSFIRKYLALEHVSKDKQLKLTEKQREELRNKLRAMEDRIYEELRRYLRKIFLPQKQGFERIDMGLPTLGERYLDSEVYSFLTNQGKVLKKLSPQVIKEKYLQDKDYLEIKKLFSAFLKTPGELRPESPEVVRDSVSEGVARGIFRFGYLKNGEVECISPEETPVVSFEDGEVIVNPELCKETEGVEKRGEERSSSLQQPTEGSYTTAVVSKQPSAPSGLTRYEKLILTLRVPHGQMITLTRITNFLKGKFDNLSIVVTLNAEGGEGISEEEYKDKILEAINQSGIDVEEENLS